MSSTCESITGETEGSRDAKAPTTSEGVRVERGMGKQIASLPTQCLGPHPDPKWTYLLAYSHVSGAEAGLRGRGQQQ